MSKISIITINYNDKNGLTKTIESVVNQTLSDFEFIVIDGNSSDGSKEVIEDYKNQISYWVSEPDSGIYNAMNKGIRAAKGDYVLFMNSGDCFLDETILSKCDKLLNDNFDIYYGNLIYFDKKKNKNVDWLFPNKLTFQFFINHSLPHQASFIKKSLFDSVFYYNENLKIASDWEFFVVAIIKNNATYKHLGITMSEYDFNGISSDPKNYALVQSEKKQTYNQYFSMFIDDYKLINELESKRIRNLLYIKNFKLHWKLIKGFTNILLLFLPKQDK